MAFLHSTLSQTQTTTYPTLKISTSCLNVIIISSVQAVGSLLEQLQIQYKIVIAAHHKTELFGSNDYKKFQFRHFYYPSGPARVSSIVNRALNYQLNSITNYNITFRFT
jgi:hypothetical protein